MNKGLIILTALMLSAPFTAACTRSQAEVSEEPARQSIQTEAPAAETGDSERPAAENVRTDVSAGGNAWEFNPACESGGEDAESGDVQAEKQSGEPAEGLHLAKSEERQIPGGESVCTKGKGEQTAQAGGNDPQAAFRAQRYIEPSTLTRFFTVKIKKADSPEVLTVITDNESWLYYSKTFKYSDASSHQNYVAFMMAHENEPFVLDNDAYDKLKKYAVEPLPKELTELSNEELIKRYTTYDNSTRSLKLRFDAGVKWLDLLHLFLERGCVLQQGCLDSSVSVWFPGSSSTPGF
ncbi:hypothetical protein IJT93_05305 [bacterium]|nr:hypothetical protein [bacterium]